MSSRTAVRRWWKSADGVLALASAAASTVIGIETLDVAASAERASAPLGLMWISTLMVWCWGTTAVGVHIIRSGGRRDIARLAFAACASAAVGLLLGYWVVSKQPDGESVTVDLVSLLVTSTEKTRPLLLVSLVTVVFAWAVIVRCPSIEASGAHRSCADLGLGALCLSIVNVAVFDPVGGPARMLGGLGTAAVLAVIAVQVHRTTRRAEVRLPRAFDLFQRWGAPVTIGAASLLAVLGAFGDSEVDSLLNRSWFAALVAFLLLVELLVALVVLTHDYVIVGGRWALRDLLGTDGSPLAVRAALRDRLNAPRLEVYFPTLDGGGLLDAEGRRRQLGPRQRARLDVVGPTEAPVALIHIGPTSTPPAQRVVLLGVASLALQRAQSQTRRAVDAETTHARRRQLAAEERGRRQLENMLHDCVQAPLIGALAGVTALAETTDDPTVRHQLAEVTERIRAAQAAIREAARGQFPHALRVGGLTAALDELAEELPIVVSRSVTVGRLGNEQAELTAYRFIAESLSNVAKHAGVSSATVEVDVEGSVLTASVTDRGSGGAQIRADGGLGTIVDQALLLGGWVDVVSRPGLGTTVVLELPLADLIEQLGPVAGGPVSPPLSSPPADSTRSAPPTTVDMVDLDTRRRRPPVGCTQEAP